MDIYCQNHPKFNYNQAKEMYLKYADFIEDSKNFDEVLENTHFYSFFVGGKFIGCIYFYLIDGKIYVNAFADRKTHNINIECFKKALSFYSCDIYARSKQKTAIYCILKCGFKKNGNNLYRLKRS